MDFQYSSEKLQSQRAVSNEFAVLNEKRGSPNFRALKGAEGIVSGPPTLGELIHLMAPARFIRRVG